MHLAISIGNTDNKLSQVEWSEFVDKINLLISDLSYVRTHFFGGAQTWAPWQNVAWLLELENGSPEPLLERLIVLRKQFSHDSVFILVGNGDLI